MLCCPETDKRANQQIQGNRRVATSGTPKRQSSGPVACGENEDSSRARGELRGRVAEVARQVGISTRGFEDPNENFARLVNGVPSPSVPGCF
jgi:hypothetical protein